MSGLDHGSLTNLFLHHQAILKRKMLDLCCNRGWSSDSAIVPLPSSDSYQEAVAVLVRAVANNTS